MRYPHIETAIWDVETDGFLHELTRIHLLVIHDYERNITYTFRRNDIEDTIDDGLDMLEDAELTVGINNIYFDIPALERVYEGVKLRGKVRDAMVMARMCFADQKEKDFRLYEQGKLPGAEIGRHTLKAWGYRLGLHKGDYAEIKEARAIEQGFVTPEEIKAFVWGSWNQEMEDYCIQDVTVTTLLWRKILLARWADEATILEHEIHDLMGRQERNGIYFNVPAAEKLAEELEDTVHKLEQTARKHYGRWWAPTRKHIVAPLWDDKEGLNKAKKYPSARKEYGEDDPHRKVWGAVEIVKKTLNYKDPNRASRTEGALFCPVSCKEFNPHSRQQVVDRFETVYNWHPVDFTETGQPEVSDEVLRKLVNHIPMAFELAEIFYYNKRLGQIKTGKNAWLKKVTLDGKIHAHVNVGGTVSGRASHVSPNLAQVPRVKFIPLKDADGEIVLNAKGKPKMVIGLGREGDHGYDCRVLFYTPEPWTQIGVDLSGIELRCFGERLAKYDGGEYLKLVLSGDPHTYNQMLAGLPTRDDAKRFIYALLYGAGDIKLGSIVKPQADEDEQAAIGDELRERFMKGLPAYRKLIAEVRGYAKQGYIPGLDGRRLFVRSRHSALNTWLQSDAALIAKEWVCQTEADLIDAGFKHGWDGDFVLLLWIHDEMQLAARTPEIAARVQEIAIAAAAKAGKHFSYKCPVDAETKHGNTWADCH